MTRSDIRWGDGPEWDEERLSNYERNTRILEDNSQMLVDVIKTLTKEEDLERTIDCAIRYLEDAIDKDAFKQVRSAIHHLNEYMAERIEFLEEQQETLQPRLPSVHRSSA
jgi:lysyl-tRNA synthetase class I